MRNLFIFIAKYNAFFTFLVLEIICFGLIIRYNQFQRVSIINSANTVAGDFLKRASDVREYIDLKETNDSLVNENARLRSKLSTVVNKLNVQIEDELCYEEGENVLTDPNNPFTHQYIGARVINNSTRKVNNFITINKGRRDGIHTEMGVISSNGIIGVVKDVSENFATVISVLHKSMRVSAKIKTNNFIGSLRWNIVDPQYVLLEDIPKHAAVNVGDTIITSGFSSFFPANIMIGKVESWSLSEGSNFYDISVKLSSNFSSLKYVYVVDYILKNEQIELEEISQDDP